MEYMTWNIDETYKATYYNNHSKSLNNAEIVVGLKVHFFVDLLIYPKDLIN